MRMRVTVRDGKRGKRGKRGERKGWRLVLTCRVKVLMVWSAMDDNADHLRRQRALERLVYIFRISREVWDLVFRAVHLIYDDSELLSCWVARYLPAPGHALLNGWGRTRARCAGAGVVWVCTRARAAGHTPLAVVVELVRFLLKDVIGAFCFCHS